MGEMVAVTTPVCNWHTKHVSSPDVRATLPAGSMHTQRELAGIECAVNATRNRLKVNTSKNRWFVFILMTQEIHPAK